MVPEIEGIHLERSIEPEHPRCTISDPVFVGIEERTRTRVAAKVLHLDFPLRPESAARFVATMRIAQQLQAPHVAPVVGAGFTAHHGYPWFAMEFVDGETLEARLARGERFAPRDVTTVLAQLVAALGAANAAGFHDTHVIAEHMILSRARGLVAWNFGVAAWNAWARDLVVGQYTCGGGQLRWHPDLTPDEAKGAPSNASNGAAALALLAFRLLAGRHYWNAANADAAEPMRLLTEAMGAIEPPRARTPHELPRRFDGWFAACLTGGIADASAALRAFEI